MMAEFHAGDRLPWHATDAEQAVQQLVRSEQYGAIWILDLKDETVGFLILTLGFSIEFHGVCAVIDEFYIRPHHRGQGHGSAALTLVGQYCARNAITTLHLAVERASPRARHLYERIGFEDRGFYLMSKWI